MARYMVVNGVFEVPDEMTLDLFWTELITWAISKQITFGGGMHEEDEDGNILPNEEIALGLQALRQPEE